jgi:hypothetical protein
MSRSHRWHGRTTLAIVYSEVGEPIAVLCDPICDQSEEWGPDQGNVVVEALRT